VHISTNVVAKRHLIKTINVQEHILFLQQNSFPLLGKEMILGTGSFGTVHKTVYNGTSSAVKILDERKLGSVKHLLELSIMATYHHPFLNNSINIEALADGTMMIYQEIATCDLKKYLKSQPQGRVHDSVAAKWIMCISSGLAFLKMDSIVHGDVKPHNILYYEQTHSVKLADFGCSIIIRGEYANSESGTIRYNAPELLLEARITFNSDVWSLGCVLYEMISGDTLIPTPSSTELSKKLRTAKSIQIWRASEGDHIHNKLKSFTCLPITFSLSGPVAVLIKAMTVYSSTDRLTIEEVMCDSWLTLNSAGECSNSQEQIVDVTCPILPKTRLITANTNVRKYIENRSLFIHDDVTVKIIHVYCRTSMSDPTDIEVAIRIVCRLFRYDIPHYHPISSDAKICLMVSRLCVDSRFRLHKSTDNDVYVSLDKCTHSSL